MGMHGHGGMRGMINSPDSKPKITKSMLMRVLQYAKPYRWLIIGMLVLILAHTGLMLLTPLILRDLIDKTIPGKRHQPPDFAGVGAAFDPRIQRRFQCHPAAAELAGGRRRDL